MSVLSKIRNFYYPVNPVVSPQLASDLVPFFESNAKDIRRFMAPVQVPRLRQDISTWRASVNEMERLILPYRYQVQVLYADTYLNGHVFAAIQKRKNLTLLKQYHICDEKGVTDDIATALITKEWFSKILNYALEAQFFGYSLIGFGDLVDGNFPNVEVIRRMNISPDREVYETIPYSVAGMEFTNPEAKDANGIPFYDWCLWVKTPSDIGVSKCGYGLLYKVALYEIYLRNLMGQNADFVELFGQPLRHIKTTKQNEDDGRTELEKAAREMGSSAYIITDPTDEIDFHDGSSGGAGYRSFDNFASRLEKTISKLILGHSDAMDSTPGKLGAGGDEESPTAQALEEIESIDSRFLEYVVNDSLIPKLIKLGIKLPTGKCFRFKNDIETDEIKKHKNELSQQLATMALSLKQAGLQMDADYFTKETGIPVTAAMEVPTIDTGFNNKVKAKIEKLYLGKHAEAEKD